jgi:hypothetical protein
MPTYELVVAPVADPSNEQTVTVEAKDPGHALIANHDVRPGTFVKSWREITDPA